MNTLSDTSFRYYIWIKRFNWDICFSNYCIPFILKFQCSDFLCYICRQHFTSIHNQRLWLLLVLLFLVRFIVFHLGRLFYQWLFWYLRKTRLLHLVNVNHFTKTSTITFRYIYLSRFNCIINSLHVIMDHLHLRYLNWYRYNNIFLLWLNKFQNVPFCICCCTMS